MDGSTAPYVRESTARMREPTRNPQAGPTSLRLSCTFTKRWPDMTVSERKVLIDIVGRHNASTRARIEAEKAYWAL